MEHVEERHRPRLHAAPRERHAEELLDPGGDEQHSQREADGEHRQPRGPAPMEMQQEVRHTGARPGWRWWIAPTTVGRAPGDLTAVVRTRSGDVSEVVGQMDLEVWAAHLSRATSGGSGLTLRSPASVPRRR